MLPTTHHYSILVNENDTWWIFIMKVRRRSSSGEHTKRKKLCTHNSSIPFQSSLQAADCSSSLPRNERRKNDEFSTFFFSLFTYVLCCAHRVNLVKTRFFRLANKQPFPGSQKSIKNICIVVRIRDWFWSKTKSEVITHSKLFIFHGRKSTCVELIADKNCNVTAISLPTADNNAYKVNVK